MQTHGASVHEADQLQLTWHAVRELRYLHAGFQINDIAFIAITFALWIGTHAVHTAELHLLR